MPVGDFLIIFKRVRKVETYHVLAIITIIFIVILFKTHNIKNNRFIKINDVLYVFCI